MSFFTICGICNEPVPECQCPDMDERIKSAVFNPTSVIASKWCRSCDKHWSRCKCETPNFYIVCGGKELDLSKGVKNLLGETVVPDLTAR